MLYNKAVELACESIPGCVLQLFVYLSNRKQAGNYALVSIGISALTTGFTSAMIAFDMDVDVPKRKMSPRFYGYLPDDNGKRTRCLVLMTMISALHNISRSVGVALLAVTGGTSFVLSFVGGEMLAFFAYKILRRDFWYWLRLEGAAKVVLAIIVRLVAKIILDFSGCLHLRHPYEMGGAAFSLSMLWAQAMPFVALSMFDEGKEEGLKREMTVGLVGSFCLWLVLNVMFFCTIDLSYLNTFFGTTTAPQYTCKQFMNAKDDAIRWDAFGNKKIEYTKTIHPQVREWVAANIERWKREKPTWFNVEKIPDEFLPVEVLEELGGAKRRRSSVSIREIVGFDNDDDERTMSGRVAPLVDEE